ncbi:hypothetical protein [Streptomyces sp. cmx-4-9]|uniref:hypothetical protein n=1 Tax=Streptomyces sp. cmx-4-9 TaxID=2790941 RepID=UPI00397ED7FD
MRMRTRLGLTLAAATLAGASAVGTVGAVGAQAAGSPTISQEECKAAGGQVVSNPYRNATCTLPDGTSQTIT